MACKIKILIYIIKNLKYNVFVNICVTERKQANSYMRQ